MSETEDNVQICDPVLLNSFVIKNKRCRVYFHRGKLIWETDGSPYNRYTLFLADVIAVDYVHSTDKTLCCPSESQGYNQEESKIAGNSNPGLSQRHTSFIIHYGVRGRNNNKWRHQTVTMNHTDPRQIASWVKTIHNYINSFTKRPKRIMVFVNPYGGKKKGLQIYEKRVKPLFELAGVNTTITITQSANHARDTLMSCSFDNIDAITCVGGDGTFAEVFNGLVLRTAKDKGIDQNDPEAILPTPSLRVGVIPAGSTDTMAYCFHGTTDVQTAVLHIIFGDSVGLDLCSVHSNATLLRYYSSVISYGYLGDVVRDSEKFRWMGPKRYDYSGFKKFFTNVGYDGEVSLLSDSSDPSKGPKCKDNCERCNKKQPKGQRIKEASAGDWKTFRGKFFMINGANVSCACVRSPNGISPYCHLGDGCIDVLLIKHTNLLNNLRLLLTLTSKEKTLFDLPFVEVHRAREFTFRALPAHTSQSESEPPQLIPGRSVWNCDGEVQWETNIKIRAHCQLLQIFTRGRQEIVEEPTCSSCRF